MHKFGYVLYLGGYYKLSIAIQSSEREKENRSLFEKWVVGLMGLGWNIDM